MADEKDVDIQQNEEQDESPYDAYGWNFHKKPLLYALILTVLFYAFIFFFINI
ncbi:MAG: hypothetical protein JXR73_14410 [Candidatus Omnitrophica bacterium]|nr:hypothetical protein [Candidatus Omnitrophota bacterium]